jgi:hypothetical protein
MVMQRIICRFCREVIGPHWQLMDHADCAPGDGPQARRLAQQQAEIRDLYRRFRERDVNLRLRHAGARVTLRAP